MSSEKGLLLFNFHLDLGSHKIKIFPKAPRASLMFHYRQTEVPTDGE